MPLWLWLWYRSVGVILYILLCGFPPFFAEGEAELIQRVRDGHFEFTSPYWDDISDAAKDLISRCLALSPNERPSPTEALTHPWVAGSSEVADDRDAVDLSDVSPPPAPATAKARQPQAKPRAAPGPAPAPAPAPAATRAAPAPPPALEHIPKPSASVSAGAFGGPGELLARIRQMRRTYTPHGAARVTTTAPPMQMTLDGGGTRFAAVRMPPKAARARGMASWNSAGSARPSACIRSAVGETAEGGAA